jgi:YidC/Oxa1 family membrane protein insertase
METAKLKKLRHRHGIYPLMNLFNLFQLPFHLSYLSMITGMSYNPSSNPELLSGGMLWFTDLTAPDPTGILPLIAGSINLLNMLTTQVNSDN